MEFDNTAKDIIDLDEESASDYDGDACYRVNGKVIHKKGCKHKYGTKFEYDGAEFTSEMLSSPTFDWHRIVRRMEVNNE